MKILHVVSSTNPDDGGVIESIKLKQPSWHQRLWQLGQPWCSLWDPEYEWHPWLQQLEQHECSGIAKPSAASALEQPLVGSSSATAAAEC